MDLNIKLYFVESPKLPETLTACRLPQAKMLKLFLKGTNETVKKYKKLGPAYKKEVSMAVGLMKNPGMCPSSRTGSPLPSPL